MNQTTFILLSAALAQCTDIAPATYRLSVDLGVLVVCAVVVLAALWVFWSCLS
jgi:hypothetical protein